MKNNKDIIQNAVAKKENKNTGKDFEKKENDRKNDEHEQQIKLKDEFSSWTKCLLGWWIFGVYLAIWMPFINDNVKR